MNNSPLSSEQFLQFLRESYTTILFATDRNYTLVDHNVSFQKLVDRDAWLTGVNLRELVTPLSMQDLQKPDSDRLSYVTLSFAPSDGAIRTISCQVVSVPDGYIFAADRLLLTESDIVIEMTRLNTDLINVTRELHRKNSALEKTRHDIKVLQGLLPICASCKKIRDEKGLWTRLEVYIHEHSEADFSHGICPECAKKLYPEFYRDADK